MSTATLLTLPTELLLQIFRYLPTRSLLRASHVCRRFYHISLARSVHLPHLPGPPYRRYQPPLLTAAELRSVRIQFHRRLYQLLQAEVSTHGRAVITGAEWDPSTGELWGVTLRYAKWARWRKCCHCSPYEDPTKVLIRSWGPRRGSFMGYRVDIVQVDAEEWDFRSCRYSSYWYGGRRPEVEKEFRVEIEVVCR